MKTTTKFSIKSIINKKNVTANNSVIDVASKEDYCDKRQNHIVEGLCYIMNTF